MSDSPIQLAMRDLPREHGFEPLTIEGRVPSDLSGTFLVAGTGLYSTFGRPYRHLFDCDGAVTAVRLANGVAHGAARIIETPELLAERRAKRPLYGGAGTPVPGGPIGRMRLWKRKNPANTTIFSWAGRTFALWEGGLPTELHPGTLRVLGRAPLRPGWGSVFSAHPRRVHRLKTHFNFGTVYTAPRPRLDLYRLHDDGSARQMGALPMPFYPFVHDFAATEKHLLFLLSPLRVDRLSMVLNALPPAEVLTWEPERGTEIIMVPIDDPTRARRFTVGPFFQWHFANAFEDGGLVRVDFARIPAYKPLAPLETLSTTRDPPDYTSQLVRGTIDPAAGSFHYETIYPRFTDFPMIHPERTGARHRWVHAVSTRGRNGFRLITADLERGVVSERDTPDHEHYGEPVIVPKAGTSKEDGVYLLSAGYDARADRSFLGIFDGQRPDDGPVCRAWFDHHIPVTFHGTWAPLT